MNRHTENGRLVMVTEHRPIVSHSGVERTGEIILRANSDKLIQRLIYDDSYSFIDPTYIQDFLLTYRVFISDPTIIANKLLEWFNNTTTTTTITTANLKRKVYRIVLEWITNHFNDFETNKSLYEFVETFQDTLNNEKMLEQFRVLTIAISTKSKKRTITLARSKRDEILSFVIQGGWDKGYGIFITKVDKDSKASELGMLRGDQIIEVNGQSFQHITYLNALETIKSFTHLSITLKYNPISFNEMLLNPEKSNRNKKNQSATQNRTFLLEYLHQEQQQQHQQQHQINETKSSTNLGNSILSQSNQNGSTQKKIGSIPPLPPRSKSKDPNSSSYNIFKTNPNNSNNIVSSMSCIVPQQQQQQSNKPTHRFRKAFEKFNRNLKPYSKNLDSMHDIDASAPSLKSITRSPSPSLSNFHTSNLQKMNENEKSFDHSMSSSEYSATISRNNSLNTLNLNGIQQQQRNNSLQNLKKGNIDASQQTTQPPPPISLASMALEDPQPFTVEHVLKIYKNDQTFKYLVVHKETSTKEVVMLTLNAFNIIDEAGSSAFSLCEVSVDADRLIKQKRLPDQMNNLAEKLPLNARYYLKNNQSPDQFLSDPIATDEVFKDANISFLQLDPLEISAQLTLRDYCVFKSIESSEYIDFLFKKKSKFGFANLKQFEDLSNEEMFWVINEILHESNTLKRAKIIKHFIQIAQICKECKNFNSLLAIIAGLDHLTVTRLKETWEKVSPKYKKILEVN
jgi:Rap guanine nucleotide exchange factor 2